MDLNEMKILVFDFETLKGCFLASIYIPEENVWYDFLINQYQNDLYKFVKFMEEHQAYYWIGFNNIGFDSQIQEFIYRGYSEWYDLSNLEISAMISQFGADVIDDQKHGLFPRYREEHLSFKQIDVPRILHWFNENKMVSLKQAEFELRAETIENFSFPVDKEEFTEDEIWGPEGLVPYCHNDVFYTYEIYKYVRGNTNHCLYKGKDKLFDRQTVINTVGLECINWDDVKIGAEWNKMDYCKATRKNEKDLKPPRINQFYGKKYKKFFPSTVEFQTSELKKFIEKMGDTFILREVKVPGKNTSKKQEFKYTFNPTLTVTIARGGLHSNEGPRLLQPNEDEIFLQNDIGSQYPNAIIKFKVYPLHLGEPWYSLIPVKIQERLYNKSMYKKTKDPAYNSLQEMGKLKLNGGSYGKLGCPGDWQEDPCAMLKVTIGCQLEILMIVEALILKGFNVTSCNTDGWDCIIPRSRLEEYFGIVEYYEEKIGNKEMGNVEYTEFAWMAQTSVNAYVAEKVGVWEKRKFIEDRIVTKGSDYPNLKMKGDFSVDIELHRNSSFRVIAIALVEYFSKDTDVTKFINSHGDIFDFCARSNAGKSYDHISYSNNGFSPLPKLIRYYVSKNGTHIKKMVKEEVDTGANDQNVQPAEFVKSVCNRLPKQDHKIHLDNVNRKWYVDKTLETIQKIEQEKKKIKKVKTNPNQLSMF